MYGDENIGYRMFFFSVVEAISYNTVSRSENERFQIANPVFGYQVSYKRCPACPPPPRSLLFKRVQTPHLKSKSTRVLDTTRQLISPHCLSSHPCRSSNSFAPLPLSFSPAPPCSNVPPKIETCQSNKHYQAADITSLSL